MKYFITYKSSYITGSKLPNITEIGSGAVIEGFLRFPETTQDCPSTMGTPFFSYKVSQGIHSMLNSSATGFCFESMLKKSRDDLFLVATKENWRSSQKICVGASLETLHEDPSLHALQKSATTGCLETTQRNP